MSLFFYILLTIAFITTVALALFPRPFADFLVVKKTKTKQNQAKVDFYFWPAPA